MTPWVPAFTEVPMEVEESWSVASAGLDTVVTVSVLLLNGNEPVAVIAVLFESNATTLEAAGIEKLTVLPAAVPLAERLIASVNVKVWPAGIVRFKPENMRRPFVNELYWAMTWLFWVKYAPETELSETTPFFWNERLVTVAAPELPAVRFTVSTGVRAAPATNEVCADWAAKLTKRPVAGAVTEVFVPVVTMVEQATPVVMLYPVVDVQPVGRVVGVEQAAPVVVLNPVVEVQPAGSVCVVVVVDVDVVANELTKARVLGPK
jgi:hypothetical protein